MIITDVGADNVVYQLDALAKVSSGATGKYDRVGWVNVESVDLPNQSQQQCQQKGWPADCKHPSWRQSQHFEADLLSFEHLKYKRLPLLIWVHK